MPMNPHKSHTNGHDNAKAGSDTAGDNGHSESGGTRDTGGGPYFHRAGKTNLRSKDSLSSTHVPVHGIIRAHQHTRAQHPHFQFSQNQDPRQHQYRSQLPPQYQGKIQPHPSRLALPLPVPSKDMYPKAEVRPGESDFWDSMSANAGEGVSISRWDSFDSGMSAEDGVSTLGLVSSKPFKVTAGVTSLRPSPSKAPSSASTSSNIYGSSSRSTSSRFDDTTTKLNPFLFSKVQVSLSGAPCL